jgi:hypothetical protein
MQARTFKNKKLALIIAATFASPALYAANFDVTQATDDGTGSTPGTLSWAILQANRVSSDAQDTISLDLLHQAKTKR